MFCVKEASLANKRQSCLPADLNDRNLPMGLKVSYHCSEVTFPYRTHKCRVAGKVDLYLELQFWLSNMN